MVKGAMTKDLLMQYTLVAMFFIALLSYNIFGLESLVICLVAVGVAVGCDLLLSLFMGSKNMNSAIVFGLIVALSYSIGMPPGMMSTETIPTLAGGLEQYLFPAIISAVGLIVFKKIQGLAGRKYVNPAAVAKLLVLGLLFMPLVSSLYNTSALLPSDHDSLVLLQNPDVVDGMGLYAWKYPEGTYPAMDAVPFASTLLSCYSNNASLGYFVTTGDVADPTGAVLDVMLMGKYHGWIGGYSSIIVMAIGIALFLGARGYIKWRITVAYLVATAVMAVIMGGIFGGDILFRMLFHVFMGSSIFLAFFMATDPATTPLTKLGQIIFGVGLGVLTVIIQTYTGFLGGSILALVIMNLTCPILDNVGVPKPSKTRLKKKLPPLKDLAETMPTDCIRCGKCLTMCPMNLPPILIKNAADKGNWAKATKLGAASCVQCGYCTIVCPARIDLKSAVAAAKEKVQ
jgi:Na+-translocating ferredoxin:NAD+ oxidoreductase RnfD subunit/NAD-dependent dihydropyrimidine dehydrogenase PreA subunit